MARLPRCDELQRASNSPEWEPMMILYCRRAITEDYRKSARFDVFLPGAVFVSGSLGGCFSVDSEPGRFGVPVGCKYLTNWEQSVPVKMSAFGVKKVK
ncbi:hypothetical protein Tco_0580796 [Tanacetum coccineum]